MNNGVAPRGTFNFALAQNEIKMLTNNYAVTKSMRPGVKTPYTSVCPFTSISDCPPDGELGRPPVPVALRGVARLGRTQQFPERHPAAPGVGGGGVGVVGPSDVDASDNTSSGVRANRCC